MKAQFQLSQAEQSSLLQDITDWMAQSPPLIEEQGPIFSSLPAQDSQSISSLPYKGNSRLGFWYQHLCYQWFDAHPNYTILADEIQLNAQGRTIGALDFLLHNQQEDCTEHWEVAVKFYLLCDGLWYGPNSQDRLDLKLSHMINHQLTMSQQPSFIAQYPKLGEIQPKLLMQGRLYTNPFQEQLIPEDCLGYRINAKNIHGNWCYFSQYHKIRQPLFILKKGQWLTGKNDDNEKLNELGERFVHCQAENGEFWFLVPDHWPQHKVES